ncbi:uncharacterized protein LOC111407057 [Olea europaea var. sylvestris]|uniref:uncharacterized protein LOC111407057 n=1 Tax=Olea europaea var. sylvestris TaxID=158386 RepID=UPI000C1CCF72|nr:uncharacterized protein LOC111407057 [Olea europaea var. sylvestris]
MASRTLMQFKRSLASSTTPKFAIMADAAAHPPPTKSSNGFKKMAMSASFAPVWMVFGMVVVATTIGIHTAKQQLCHSPSVQLTKKKRECVPEVEIPDVVTVSGSKFINKSFLRKVAHIQDDKRTLNDHVRPDPFTSSRDNETLKSVGVSK